MLGLRKGNVASFSHYHSDPNRLQPIPPASSHGKKSWTMTSHSEIVTEEQVQLALDYLRDNAERLGQLTTNAHFAESWVKVVLAIAMKNIDGPVNAQEREARASNEYQLAIREQARTAGELATEKAMREAAAMKIEVWRTQQATWRAMKL